MGGSLPSAIIARPIRIEREGGWYHVTARGNERRPIYPDNRDRQHFCELLAERTGRFAMKLSALVLMDNHYHLLVELVETNLSRAPASVWARSLSGWNARRCWNWAGASLGSRNAITASMQTLRADTR